MFKAVEGLVTEWTLVGTGKIWSIVTVWLPAADRKRHDADGCHLRVFLLLLPLLFLLLLLLLLRQESQLLPCSLLLLLEVWLRV
jgi:hypothetical protein